MLPDKVVLLIDKRREQSVKYKKNLETKNVTVFVENSFGNALKKINDFEPDLILISDSTDDISPNKAIEQIRVLTYDTRPAIVMLSKSNDITDKISALDAGADDFLSEPIVQEEFLARTMAHLRRNFESNLNDKTRFFNSKMVFRMIKRIINKKTNWAILLADIDNFDNYKELYGELAADKILQTYGAIIKAAIDDDDFVGQLSNENFVIITSSFKSEKIANYMTCAFDTVVSKFYNKNDIERGFLLMQNEDEEGNKIAIATTSIGIISNEYRQYGSVNSVISDLILTHKLAKHFEYSNYIVNRPKISAQDAIETKKQNYKVLIVEPDEAMSFLLSTSIEIAGYQPMVINKYQELLQTLNEFKPALIILDAGSGYEQAGIEYCKKIKVNNEYSNINVIFTSTLHDKENILGAGADLYLPKPYEISHLLSLINKFMEDFNN